MTQSVPASMPASNADVVDRYEELRGQVLSPEGRGSGSQGLTLFLRQGMKGWMDVWSRCRIAGPTKVPVKSSPVEGTLPWDLRAEVVAILAGMALSIGQEMRA
jgi:hypothetical protein